MLAGMDDREDPSELITMEAMNGLSRIFDRIDEGHVRPILINIALRIRPCFEKVADDMTRCPFYLNCFSSPLLQSEQLLLIYLVLFQGLVMDPHRDPSWSRYKLILLVCCFI